MTPLKRLLFDRQLKSRWLAQECGLNESGLNLIINGKRNPSIIVALKIAKALEVSVEELWGYLIEKEEDHL